MVKLMILQGSCIVMVKRGIIVATLKCILYTRLQTTIDPDQNNSSRNESSIAGNNSNKNSSRQNTTTKSQMLTDAHTHRANKSQSWQQRRYSRGYCLSSTKVKMSTISSKPSSGRYTHNKIGLNILFAHIEKETLLHTSAH